MTGRLHQKKQELAALEENTTQQAQILRNYYQTYLESLSQSVYKQLILASYQICTQKYPQEFINLSYSQRQKLQEQIKTIGKTTIDKLIELLNKKHKKHQEQPINILEEMLLGIAPTEEEVTPLETEEEIMLENSDTFSNIKKPDELIEWTKHIEKGITQVLDTLSMEINNNLQKYKILPNQLPKQVLEMAIKAETPEHPTGGQPNLLDVIIETGNKGNDAENIEVPMTQAQVTKLVAIHLRLHEIEFTEPILTLQRKQIRQILEQINQLKKQYQKKEKECAIAEAETAWRSSWYD
ncbi:hypothetical protein C7H19_06330 [Aphanothece hegewaldii CCALA 016]|uniref:Uncharacterized protein n=1 Tax=Aphanothece hegewaldii CCALA 016 TaxID=2107694 RepID=A0A2T1M0G0_9CHRO|nr:hypothetical protein [Aphanothece hegewaldii]PSF38085.1 hypothetical protein C7H19_06330 [Aphanothece hegewaldii CCALA 016]